MATLSFDGDWLRVALTSREKIAGLHGNIEVPLDDVRDVRLEPDPIGAVQGLRGPGLAIPGRRKIGTWRGRGRRSFIVARRGVPAVRISLTGTRHDELLVSTPDAKRIAAEIGARIAT